MVITFPRVTPHLQHSVLKKLTFNEFSVFLQCSQHSNDCSKLLKGRLPWETYSVQVRQKKIYLDIRIEAERIQVSQLLEDFPVRIVVYLLYLTGVSNNTCQEVIKLIEERKIQTENILVFKELKRLSPSLFNKLLQISNIQKIEGHVSGDSDYIKQSEFQKIPKLDLTPGDSFPIENLLLLTASHILLSDVHFTATEINQFLKQWYNGSRVLNKLVLGYSEEEIHMTEDSEMFTGIPFDLIWSKDHHPNSVVSDRGVSELESIEETCRYYALKRGDAELFVEVEDDCFVATSVKDASEHFVTLSLAKESDY